MLFSVASSSFPLLSASVSAWADARMRRMPVCPAGTPVDFLHGKMPYVFPVPCPYAVFCF
jgi:hypothetical protein